MSEEYGADFISITDEEGKEYELEILADLEYKGNHYLALIPAGDESEDEELEVSILKTEDENGEQILVTIDDDQELEEVYQAMMDMLYEEEEGAES